jgi:hypothetical protein
MSSISVSAICGIAFYGIEHAQELIRQIEEFQTLHGNQSVIVDWLGVEIMMVDCYLYYLKHIRSKQLESYIENTNTGNLKRLMSLVQHKLLS